MSALVQYAIAVSSGLTTIGIGYIAREAHAARKQVEENRERSEKNKERSIQNRLALRRSGIVESFRRRRRGGQRDG